MDHALRLIRRDEAGVDPRYWIDASNGDIAQWHSTMGSLLDYLVEDGLYDSRMLSILKRVRCKSNPGTDECVGIQATVAPPPVAPEPISRPAEYP